jgi:hypothetical protein
MADVTISNLNNLTSSESLLFPVTDNSTTGKISIKNAIDTIGLRTSSLNIPIGTTEQRPVTPATGTIRFNTTLNILEFYNGSAWRAITSIFADPLTFEYLAIGGGGGGAGADGGGAGGGGAGGIYLSGTLTLASNTSHVITIGSGGAGGGGNGGHGPAAAGSAGTSTSIGSHVIAAGGAGGERYIQKGGTGAGGEGTGLNGGPGLTSSINGSSVCRAGGGSGSNNFNSYGTATCGGGSYQQAGTANTGGGGCAGTYPAGNDSSGRSGRGGGSGIVIIAYNGPKRAIGGTESTTSRPGYTVHTFNSNDTFTIN